MKELGVLQIELKNQKIIIVIPFIELFMRIILFI